MRISRRRKISTVTATCGAQIVDRKINKDLMLMLGLNHIIDQLGKANSVLREGMMVIASEKNIEAQCERNKARQK